ncbi:hypothetical protein DFH09DRAFT_1250613 [Mycena vulgaris]|nr:hypothetical protein DFH09DRAFT_1250613 [Mycena vulgaris]
MATPPGVHAALASTPPTRTAAALFSLANRVALITGGHRGIGLEMALALAEAGAVVYCFDMPDTPDADWLKVQAYAAAFPDLPTGQTKGRLEYLSGDVTDQQGMWRAVEGIVEREGRIDVCMANAGILAGGDCLEYSAEEFRKARRSRSLIDVNVSGVLFTAQAAGRQMVRLGIKGSIVLTGSMSGSITNPKMPWIAYNTSKAAVLQLARSLGCELAPKEIRVNSISPGSILTSMTRGFLAQNPGLDVVLSGQNPMNRFATPDDLRGVVLWLASDASSFCTAADIKVDGEQTAR